jgi:hypothetical protein
MIFGGGPGIEPAERTIFPELQILNAAKTARMAQKAIPQYKFAQNCADRPPTAGIFCGRKISWILEKQAERCFIFSKET